MYQGYEEFISESHLDSKDVMEYWIVRTSSACFAYKGLSVSYKCRQSIMRLFTLSDEAGLS